MAHNAAYANTQVQTCPDQTTHPSFSPISSFTAKIHNSDALTRAGFFFLFGGVWTRQRKNPKPQPLNYSIERFAMNVHRLTERAHFSGWGSFNDRLVLS